MSELPPPERLQGQDTALRTFDAALASGRVAGAYLLHGPAGTGRSLGAALFAHALQCERRRGLHSCGGCRPCRWNRQGTHPDHLVVDAARGPRFDDDAAAARAGIDRFVRAARAAEEPAPRRTIAVRALRRLLDHLALAPAGGGWKVAVLDAFDEVEEEGTALLLKTLEEAPPRTVFLLLARGTDGIPDTILSRCQRVRFQPLAGVLVRSIAARHGAGAFSRLPDAEQALVTRLAQGSPGRALALASMDAAARAAPAVATLGAAPAPPADLLQWLRDGGTDLDSQRERAREILAMALLLARDGSGPAPDALVPAVRTAYESLTSNVGPDWLLRGLWIRVRRAAALSL